MDEYFAYPRSSYYITENILDWPGQLAVLKLSPPMVFVRFEEAAAYMASYESWKRELTVVEWIGKDKGGDSDLEEILVDIWNFLAMHEEEEERQEEERIDIDDFDT